MSTPQQANLSSPQEWLNPWGLTRIKGVAVGKMGEFTDKFGNPVSFSADDLNAMSRAAIPPGQRPGIHIGHPNSTFVGEMPRLGSIEALYFDGQYLRADYVNVPVWNAMDFIESGRFPDRSLELYREKGKTNWEVTGLAQLGASVPAIGAMPPITADMVEWMDPAAHEDKVDMTDLSLNRDPQEVIWLTGTLEPEAKETQMGEVTQADLAALSGKFDEALALLKKKDEEVEALRGELETAKTQLSANSQQTASLALAARQNEAIQLANGLLSARKVTPAMNDPERGNLTGLLLHAMGCPDIQLADGKVKPCYQAWCDMLSMQPSLVPQATQFSQATPAPRYELPLDGEDQTAAHQAQITDFRKAHPNLSLTESLQQMAAGRS